MNSSRRFSIGRLLFALMLVLPVYVAMQSPGWIKRAFDLPTGSAELRFAAGNDDLRQMAVALKDGADIHSVDAGGADALHCAVMGGAKRAMIALVSAGANVNALDG